jgi:hypothetical protein
VLTKLQKVPKALGQSMPIFDIQKVPRNPDEAVQYLLSLLKKNETVYFDKSKDVLIVDKEDFYEIMHMLTVAADKSTFSDVITSYIRSMASRALSDLTESRGIPKFERI